MNNHIITVIKLAVFIRQSSFQIATSGYLIVDRTKNYKWFGESCDPWHSWFPNMMLKRGLYHDRYVAREVFIYEFEKGVGGQCIGIWRKLVVFDAESIYVALLDLVTTH
jgi:hypothetical protein